MPSLRLATPADAPEITSLIDASVRRLSVGYYTPTQIESSLRYVFGLDTQLVADGTYFVVEDAGRIVACGGWSRRRTLYGGDQMKQTEDPLLDPLTEAARIRAFFVHPDHARRGLGRMMFERCLADAARAGFRTLELGATLPGVPLYQAIGFAEVETLHTVLPDGVEFPVVRMVRAVGE